MTEAQQQQKREARLIRCPMCNQPTTVTDPRGMIMNNPLFSQILSVHETPQKCTECGALIQAVIAKAQIGYDYVKVEPPKEASTIIQPGAVGMRRKQ